MAPNRKSTFDVAQTLEEQNNLNDFLTGTLQPKFLPLTHPASAEAEAVHFVEATSRTAESFDYWEWSGDGSIEENDKNLCVLSSDNIVSNLIQEASRIHTKVEEEEEPVSKEEYDEYWAEGNDQIVEDCEDVTPFVPTQPLNDLYWEWSSHPSKEAPVCLLSSSAVHHYWTWPSNAADHNENVEFPSHVSYWTWKTDLSEVARDILATHPRVQAHRQQQLESEACWSWSPPAACQ